MSGRAGVAAAAWTTLAVLVGTGVPAAAVAPEGTDSAGAVGTTVTEVPLVVPPAAAAAARGPSPEAVVAARVAPTADRVLTDPIPMDDHQTLGLTWPAGADGGTLEPRVRVLADGEWSAWREVPHEEVTADPGTADAAHAGGARGGTESVWVGDAAEAVQLSFAATDAGGPDGLALVLVGSDLVAPTAATEPLAAGSLAGDLAAVAPVPQLVSRAEWGAAPQVCTPDVASRGLVGAVLHHTAGSNAYATQAEAMQQIRNDQRYHITGRGWCDLGYNFVVDKWGTVYEGRANSATQPVIGVHAGGFNTGTVGISMLGEYGALTPPAAVQESVARVVAWRLGQYHRDPAGWLTYRTLGGENSRFPAGTDVTLPVLFSHRDVGLTACPGNAGYQTLGWLRERARQLVGTTFVNPAATPTTLSPDTPVTVRAATLGDISWRLEVTHAVSGQLLASSVGYAQQAFGGVVASWDGRGPDGQYVGIGRYRLTLTGVDEAGRAVVPWTSTVSALRDPDPPTVDPVPLVGGLELVPVTPARLLDTRDSGVPVGPRSRLDLDVTGVAGVPADARAVALNVTAVSPTATTYVTAWPAGRDRPTSSVLNADPARSASAAGVVVGVGGEGKVSLYNNAGTPHLVVDVTGYYVEDGGAGYAPLATAARLLDTRTDGGRMTPHVRRTVQVAGRGGVPADATAVVMNVVSSVPVANGYVAVVPRGVTPTVSTVNHLPGQDVANRTTVPLSDDGQVDVVVEGGATFVVLDVVGWFGPGGQASFTPVEPARAFDTRVAGGPLGAGQTRTLPVAAPTGVPADAGAVAMTTTATGQTAPYTYLTVWPAGTARPPTSDLNTGRGRDQANSGVVPLGTGGAVQVYNNLGSTHVVGDVYGWYR